MEDRIRKQVEQIPAWLQTTGEYPEIVLSSRARLARNLSPFRFSAKATPEDREEVRNFVLERLRLYPEFDRLHVLEVQTLSDLARQVLVERHLLTRDALKHPEHTVVLYEADESLALLINEEDHLRVQVLANGLALSTVAQRIQRLGEILGLLLPLAYHPEFGYLTSCPTNTGLGLRFSVLMHLPGLVLSKRLTDLVKLLARTRNSIRGLYGEGSEILGNLFQISTTQNLGLSEEELLLTFQDTVHEIIRLEQEARQQLEQESPELLDDRIQRARALLENARLISFEETARLTSALRLGVGLGRIYDVRIQTLNEILLYAQPGHLQVLFGHDMEPRERDLRRATYIRTKLQTEGSEP